MISKLIYVTVDYISYQKKIDGQIKALSQYYEIHLCAYNTKKKCYFLAVYNAETGYKIEIERMGEWRRTSFWKHVKECKPERFDCIYIRRPGISIINLGPVFWKRVDWDKTKLVYEIPTYPFERQTSLKKKMAQTMELRYTQKFVFRHSSLIPVYSRLTDCRKNAEMVDVYNCVDAESFLGLMNYSLPEIIDGKLKLLGVAHYADWHAYDRLIDSIEELSKEDSFEFFIYGNLTTEAKRLKERVEAENLTWVHFVEEKDVPDFCAFAAQFHIGIGCLGIHRKDDSAFGKILDTSIKNKEYCAMGIPFIHSSRDLSFSNEFKYHYLVEPGEVIIDVNAIVEWYQELRQNGFSRYQMWEYAQKNLSFESYARTIQEKLG